MKVRASIISIFFIQLFSLSTSAQCRQRIRGIYRTSEEFKKGSLAFSNNCKTRDYKIRLNDFFSKPYVSIKQAGDILRVSKSKIFAYKTCCDKVYRFRQKKELLLLNPGEYILVYKLLTSKPPTGRTNVTNYYFSIGAEGSVEKLTIKNSKTVIPNKRYHQLLDEYFRYNTELAQGKTKNNNYQINNLLKMGI